MHCVAPAGKSGEIGANGVWSSLFIFVRDVVVVGVRGGDFD